MILLWLAVLAISIIILIHSADKLTFYSVEVGTILKIPRFIIGATAIAIGTSLPEVVTSIIAILQENPVTDFAASIVVGSNIANIGLVLGISAFISYEAIFKKKLVSIDIPLFFIATALFVLTTMDGSFNFRESLLMLATYAVFMTYSLKLHPSQQKADKPSSKKVTYKHVLWILASIGGIWLGAEYTIESLLKLAELLDLSTSTLTLSIAAIGTSLPEIIVSTKATIKGHFDVALGNIFGSNMFNMLVVMGVLGLFQDLTVSQEVLTLGIPFLIAITLAAILIKIDNKITAWEGMMLLLIYILFLGKLYAFI